MDGTPHIAPHAPPARGRIAAAAAACLLVAGLVACRAFEIGVPGEWTWRWNDAPLWDRAWLPACFFLLLLGVLLAGHAHREAMRPHEEAVLVALVVALAFAFQVSTLYLGKGAGQEVVFATLTPWVSGYFDAARHDVAGLRPFLARYPDYILSLPMKGSMIHVGQHPPGCVLFYWAQLQLFESSPALSDLMQRAGGALTFGGARALDVWRGPELAGPERAVVWSSFFLLAGGCALAVAPVYLLARQWAGRAAGLLAAGLLATTPSVHLFSPHVDQLHVPLSAGVCGLWAWALHRRSKWLAVATGLGLGLCLFVSLHFVALAALCVLAAAMLCGRDRDAAKRHAWLCAWLGVGLSAAILFQYLAFSHNVLRVWWICLSKHATFYDLFPRTYWKWVLVNLVEFGLFTGAATACLWVVACGAQAKLCLGTRCDRRRRRLRIASPAAPGAPAAMCLAGLVVLLLLDVSGKNLSEVARLWMFLMPLAAVGGGVVLSRWGAGGYLPWLVVAAQGVQVIVFKLRLDVFSIY